MIPEPAMTSTTLKKIRARAYQAQGGRCYYCDHPMWITSNCSEQASSRLPAAYQCTAEHLLARCEGGKDSASNVVAACLRCNLRRHRRKGAAPEPEAYQRHVRKRIAMGKWHPELQTKRTSAAMKTTGQP